MELDVEIKYLIEALRRIQKEPGSQEAVNKSQHIRNKVHQLDDVVLELWMEIS